MSVPVEWYITVGTTSHPYTGTDDTMPEGFSYGNERLPQLDIAAPRTPVEIEFDPARAVLYVHIEGFTCLRINQIPESKVWFRQISGMTQVPKAQPKPEEIKLPGEA